MSIQISAIICTFNRADHLRKSLKSLAEQTLVTELYEILVIDNCSTDETKKVVTAELVNIPNLHYIYEPKLGLSQARNTGWQHAKGKYIAYLDDDAIANPQWLEDVCKAFEEIQPQPGCVGGKTEPIWESTKPLWLPDEFLSYLTIVDWSDKPIFLENNQFIAGANMAILRSLLVELGGFTLDLGRKGKSLLSCEEILLRDQIRDKGYGIYYDPDIFVKHFIPSSRLTQSWFTQRLYWQGVSRANLFDIQVSSSKFRLIKSVMGRLLELIKSPMEVLYLWMPTDKPERFKQKCNALWKIGYMSGLTSILFSRARSKTKEKESSQLGN
ncbi:glycosyltransferase [Acaryochloris sp. IP29b_bin.137]|uniref:glycosyltransferase family 2 protein n=1 Tax=Acaryochloris sp. IP29b_bin.137 TaxID=2969217 RepID=UPI002616AF23|nr:glycosyltransferase [Acaryochloris sp. IP29b_bin.137]